MRHFFYIFLALLLSACQGTPEIPAVFTATQQEAVLMPDYANVVVPPNIAPLNYMVDEDGVEACVARYSFPGGTKIFGKDNKIIIGEAEWRDMLLLAKGNTIEVELFVRKSGEWSSRKPFTIEVAPDSIDPYISYRLIPPSYSTFEELYIMQRNVESFSQDEIYNNLMLDSYNPSHCINCHAFQNYHTNRMQFHVRADHAGTVIYDNGSLKKVNLKRGEAISAGVYPAWHPSLNLIAYSMNKTFQNFHTTNIGKVEVQDSEAGMMMYDVENDEVTVICNEPNRLNAFPAWSPDGNYLYYASAEFTYKDSVAIAQSNNLDQTLQHEIVGRYDQVHYDIVRRAFNTQTKQFGAEEMVWQSSANNQSLTVPRISPDGRYLLCSIGDYGVFHIWHPESDLCVADLTTLGDSLQTYELSQANSPRADSYHNWSSNGRWIMFESRRSDNNYTRLYFAYFDREGRAHKAFQLPQKDPQFETLNLFSYNVPEFMVEAVKTSPKQLAKTVE